MVKAMRRVLSDREVKAMAANCYRLIYLNNLTQVVADCLDSVCVDLRCVCQRLEGDASMVMRQRLRRMIELTRGVGRLQKLVCGDVRNGDELGLASVADSVNELLEAFMPGADLGDEAKRRLLGKVEEAWNAMKKGQEIDVDCVNEVAGLVRRTEARLLSAKAKGGEGYA